MPKLEDRQLLFVTQFKANLFETLHQILEIHEIFPVLFANRHKLDVNCHAHGGIVRRKFVRIIALANRPNLARPVHSHPGMAHFDVLEHAKDGLAVKAASRKVPSYRHTVPHIRQKSIEGLLGLEEVVKGKHADGHVRPVSKDTGHCGLLNGDRNGPVDRRGAKDGPQQVGVFGRRPGRPCLEGLLGIPHGKDHGRHLVPPLVDERLQVPAIRPVLGVPNAHLGNVDAEHKGGPGSNPHAIVRRLAAGKVQDLLAARHHDGSVQEFLLDPVVVEVPQTPSRRPVVPRPLPHIVALGPAGPAWSRQ